MFDAEIKKGKPMYKQYLKGYVDNHSVGMHMYLFLCINSDDKYYREGKGGTGINIRSM